MLLHFTPNLMTLGLTRDPVLLERFVIPGLSRDPVLLNTGRSDTYRTYMYRTPQARTCQPNVSAGGKVMGCPPVHHCRTTPCGKPLRSFDHG